MLIKYCEDSNITVAYHVSSNELRKNIDLVSVDLYNSSSQYLMLPPHYYISWLEAWPLTFVTP